MILAPRDAHRASSWQSQVTTLGISVVLRPASTRLRCISLLSKLSLICCRSTESTKASSSRLAEMDFWTIPQTDEIFSWIQILLVPSRCLSFEEARDRQLFVMARMSFCPVENRFSCISVADHIAQNSSIHTRLESTRPGSSQAVL